MTLSHRLFSPRQAVQYVEDAQHPQGEGDLRKPMFEAERDLHAAPGTAQALSKIGPQERWQTVHEYWISVSEVIDQIYRRQGIEFLITYRYLSIVSSRVGQFHGQWPIHLARVYK